MKKHPVDLLSLLTGLVFLMVALAYLVGAMSDRTPSVQVAMPLMLMGLGVAGLVAAIAAQQRSDDTAARAEAAAPSVGDAEPEYTPLPSTDPEPSIGQPTADTVSFPQEPGPLPHP